MMSIVILFVTLSTVTVYGNVYTNTREILFDDLFHRYNSAARPHDEGNDITHVNMSLGLKKLIEHNEDVLTVDIWPTYVWHDNRLMWDVSKYDGLTHFVCPATLIWLPDITVYNSGFSHTSVATHQNVWVGYDGTVVFIPHERRLVNCEENTDDVHAFHCTMIFGSWTEGADGIGLKPIKNDVDLDLFSTSPKMTLQHTDVTSVDRKYDCCPVPFEEVHYRFTIEVTDHHDDHHESTTEHHDEHHESTTEHHDEHHESTTEHHDEHHESTTEHHDEHHESTTEHHDEHHESTTEPHDEHQESTTEHHDEHHDEHTTAANPQESHNVEEIHKTDEHTAYHARDIIRH